MEGGEEGRGGEGQEGREEGKEGRRVESKFRAAGKGIKSVSKAYPMTRFFAFVFLS